MSNINNDPTFGLTGHSTMGKSIGLITAEDIKGSEWRRVIHASTILGTLNKGKRKKERIINWKGSEMRDYPIRMGELSTEAGAYANANSVIDILNNVEPYKRVRVSFKEICYGDQIIKLKSPIKIEAMSSDAGFSLYYKPLDILVSAPTLDECEEDLQEELDVLYEEYAKEADENLTESARKLKSELLSLENGD